MFTPKGLSVSSLHFLISSLTISAGALPAAIIPRPPALETADARLASAIHAIAPWKIGYLIPNISQILDFIFSPVNLSISF